MNLATIMEVSFFSIFGLIIFLFLIPTIHHFISKGKYSENRNKNSKKLDYQDTISDNGSTRLISAAYEYEEKYRPAEQPVLVYTERPARKFEVLNSGSNATLENSKKWRSNWN